MNERVKELAEQAGFRSNPDIYDRNQSFDISMFAELIVQECMRVASPDHTSTPEHSAYYVEKAIDRIAEHFGLLD
jgi:hypothetical protein